MILLTGERHGGKTGLAMEIIAQARAKGLHVAGIASPGLWEGGQRSGFDILELDTGQRYPLSRRIQGLRPMPFMFDAQALSKGKAALSQSRCRDADLLVVDEVGPWELEGGGWADRLPGLLSLHPPVQIWVVRRSLAQAVQRHFGFQARIVDLESIRALEQIFPG